jgi:hypothetical protein
MRHSPIPRSLAAAITLTAIVSGLSACAGASPGASGDPSPSTEMATAQDVHAFVACMRSHGLPDFPEVTVSSDGLINFDIRGERVDADSEDYGRALEACQALLPDGARLPDAPDAPPAPPLR